MIFDFHMNNSQIKYSSESKDSLRCVKCSKLLAKNFTHGEFEIKCPRCGTLNAVLK